MHLQPDTLLQGRYRVVRLIAQGGMGAVYEAVDTRLGSTVALKQTLMADPALREAFEREARLLAALQHPALPVVSDHFAEDGGQFLVMQYIPGEDLAALLRARGAPFPVERVLSWAAGLLDALAYLHGRTPPIIHRDIKPQNLKVAPHGGVILLDFGLAKGVAAGATSPAPSLFGYTPQYAPIEQIQGSGTDARSDLYALAATLAELLTGAPPPDALTRVAATVRGLPDPLRPVLESNPTVPVPVSAAIQRSLALNPALRHPSAAALRADLLSAAQAPLAPTPDSGPGKPAPALPTAARHAPATGPTVALGAAAHPATDGPTVAATGSTIAAGRAVRRRGWAGGLVLVAFVAALLLASAVGTFLVARTGGDTSPTAGAASTSLVVPTTGEAASTPTRSGPGATVAAPVPYGSAGTFGPLTVRVLDNQRGREALTAMRRANQFNDLPPDGYEYFLVKVALEPSASIGNMYPRLVGDHRVLYAPGGVSPAPLPEVLAPGQRVEVWLPYFVAIGEEDLLIHFATVLGDPPEAPLFLAADEGARLEPDPSLEGILPDEQGVAHDAPAPLGATVISEDYAITVLAARRGPAVLDALIARYSEVARPRDGYEFALVHLRVRYLGDGGSLGWESLGPSDFKSIRASAASARDDLIDHPRVYILPEDLLDFDVNLLPGGTFEGWTVLELPVGADDAALVFTPGFALDDLNTRYLALQ